jgi:hypothetical protein
MITAKHISPRLDEAAGIRAALVLCFLDTTLEQVESHVR